MMLFAHNVCSERCHGDARSEKCLYVNIACGKYKEIISVLTMEVTGISLKEKYFLGSAYYGLFFRASLQDDKCQYARSAKNVLRDYLLQMSRAYHKDDGGNWGTSFDMQLVYHATKMYKNLDQFSGCLNDGMTYEEASILVKEQTVSFIDNIFLDSSNKEISDAKKSIFDKVNDIISKASDFETKMAMKIVELNTAERHLNEIALVFQNEFGIDKKADLNKIKVLDDYAILSSLKNKYNKTYEEIDRIFIELKSYINMPSSNKAYMENNKNNINSTGDVKSKVAQAFNQSSIFFEGLFNSDLMQLINSYENSGDNLLKNSLETIIQSVPDLKKLAEQQRNKK